MLISKVTDEVGGEDGRAGMSEEGDHAPEYQTASELFELMTKNRQFDSHDEDSLTTRDLVLLYKNIDLGTKLMNGANGIKVKKPNQYVETVIYNDEPESDSDLSEIYSAEDVQNVFMVNQERLDFLNDKSLENLLCPKLGGLEIKSSDISTNYDKQFLFKDPYIKNQLKNLNVMGSCSEFNNIFSTSLIEYICCKRLEDNYNFYMENIIRYVQHTIEQLKRISNGDYLTDRAKEKWREVNDYQETNTKVLATSTSIPLHVECKSSGNATWDDIVHSEVDVRSLSKILERKIVVEIPKLICGSYRLYSKRCADNLIISCQREQQKIEKGKESRVDVVLQLHRSQTGQVMSNISSIMVLQTSQALPDLLVKEILPLPYKEENEIAYLSTVDDSTEPTVTVIELSKHTDENVAELDPDIISILEETEEQEIENQERQGENSVVESTDYPCSEYNINASCEAISNRNSSESSSALKKMLDKSLFPLRNGASLNVISPDELRIKMQRLNMPASVLEEAGEDTPQNTTIKNKSGIRVRIKSPYENKSFILEEKKRKRLLEIRERRERKKMALSEKISKHKYGKGALMPQASSSVTKLSITNKSFYDSIYGHNCNNDDNPLIVKGRKRLKTCSATDESLHNQEQYFESPMLTPDKNSKKYINRSYYLDDTETEMMYIQMKHNGNKDVQNPNSASNSVVSNELNASLNILSQLIGPSVTNINNPTIDVELETTSNSVDTSLDPSTNKIAVDEVPQNTTIETKIDSAMDDPKKNVSSVECRKSIDNLYDLMKTFAKPSTDLKTCKSKLVANLDMSDGTGGSTVLGSDSGTSVKHHITSSNPSCFSFEKKYAASAKLRLEIENNNRTTVVPKVIISSKLHTPKTETDKSKKDHRRSVVSPLKRSDNNPLKAISQLLHEFDNIQKNRQKSGYETRPPKKLKAVMNDGKSDSHQNSFRRRSSLEMHIRDNDQERKLTPTHIPPREKRPRPMAPLELARIPFEEKQVDRVTKKKIADIIDEAKEARGEAVRGPSKFYSRLNSLAQPKRSYVQAHSEEYQNRYGRNIMSDRLQRLAAAPSPAVDRSLASPNRNRGRKSDGPFMASAKQPASLGTHLDKSTRLRRSASSSPSRHQNQAPGGYKHSGPTCDVPDTIRKMVAVESYVRDHYGRPKAAPSSNEMLLSGHKSLVPLVPNDIELASMTSSPTAEEANELGHKLHRIIDSMLTSAEPLTALAESCESNSKLRNSIELTGDVFCQDADRTRSDSDYRIDILQDSNLETAVGNIAEEHRNKEDSNLNDIPQERLSNYSFQALNSNTELEKLESALYQQISGTFQKRLRLKNLTLTPKHSMQQVFLVQSGDVSSLLVKSTVSNLKMSKCNTGSVHEMKLIPVLSNSHLDWNFSQIPMQIATVGYAFPEYQAGLRPLSPRVKVLEVPIIENSDNTTNKSDKINQCFKGFHQESSETSAQVNAEDEIATVSGVESWNHATMSPVHEVDPTLIADEIPHGIENRSTTNDAKKEVKEIIGDQKAKECNDCDKAPAESDNTSNIYFVKAFHNDKEKEKTASAPSLSSDAVDYTTSLDMLVGLLNEIQKITCQNQVTSANNDQNCADLEPILNDTDKMAKNTSHDLISISSLDKLRQLESDASIYSLYISNDEGDTTEAELTNQLVNQSKSTDSVTNGSDSSTKAENEISSKEVVGENVKVGSPKPNCLDKEINVNLYEKEHVNTFTDVTSSLMPLAVNHSTNVTSSCIGVISEPSTQSMLAFTDYQTVYCNNVFRDPSIAKTIELPQIEVNSKHVLSSPNKTYFIEQCPNKMSSFSFILKTEDTKRENGIVARGGIAKYCVNKFDLDPMFKFKRDILVTVYSILVLTVFVALSFPELMFEE